MGELVKDPELAKSLSGKNRKVGQDCRSRVTREKGQAVGEQGPH